jgi:hypothetical protein
MNRRAPAVIAALASAAIACGGSDGVGPPPPPATPADPGPINFDLAAAPGDHGAIQLSIVGGAVDSVTGLSGYEVFSTSSPTGSRALVFGSIVDGPLIRVWVPDLSRASRYTVAVSEGAIRGTYQLVLGSSYQVTRRAEHQ